MESFLEIKNCLKHRDFVVSSRVDPDIRNLILSILQKNKSRRLKIDAILEHRAVQKFSNYINQPVSENDKKFLAKNFCLNAANQKNRFFPKLVFDLQNSGALSSHTSISTFFSKKSHQTNIPKQLVKYPAVAPPEIRINQNEKNKNNFLFPVQFVKTKHENKPDPLLTSQQKYNYLMDEYTRSNSASHNHALNFNIQQTVQNEKGRNIRNASVENKQIYEYNYFQVGMNHAIPNSKSEIRETEQLLGFQQKNVSQNKDLFHLNKKEIFGSQNQILKENADNDYNLYSNFQQQTNLVSSNGPTIHQNINKYKIIHKTEFKAQANNEKCSDLERSRTPVYKLNAPHGEFKLINEIIYRTDVARSYSVESKETINFQNSVQILDEKDARNVLIRKFPEVSWKKGNEKSGNVEFVNFFPNYHQLLSAKCILPKNQK